MTLEDLRKGATEPGDDGSRTDKPPQWLDVDKMRRGQEFARKNLGSLGIAWHYSLTIGFCLTNLLQALVFTNNSNSPEKAFPRYIHTFIHIYRWITGDFWENSEGKDTTKDTTFRSLMRVRGMHNGVARAMASKLPAKPGGKKYISQYDMALVQSGFVGAVIMYPRHLGIDCTKEELEDYIHLWRAVGYALGIQDRYNLCDSDNYEETYNIVKQIETQVVIPLLANPPDMFQPMVDAYIDGVNSQGRLSLTSQASVIAKSFDMNGQPRAPLGWPDKMRYAMMEILVFFIMWLPGFRWLMMKNSEYMASTYMKLHKSAFNKVYAFE